MKSKFLKKVIALSFGMPFSLGALPAEPAPVAPSSAPSPFTDCGRGVNVATLVPPDTGKDVYRSLQAVIDANPNKTLYFPDGEYIVSHSLCTPADPEKSVSLHLADFAVIKASDDFQGEAVIRMGGKDPFNTVQVNGSNYSLIGGIIDGNGIANGVSIDSGRETKIQNTSIKHTVIGLHIKHGANSGSSDADISNVNIVGNRSADSVGMLIEGFDNTFTNMRIGCVRTGVVMKSAGNALTNIHPLFGTAWENYPGSCGFVEYSSNNLYTYCYSDQFETCFRIIGDARSVYTDCFGMWYTGQGKICRGFQVEAENFNSVVTNARIDLRDDTDNTVYSGPLTGTGKLKTLLINEDNANSDKRYKQFMTD